MKKIYFLTLISVIGINSSAQTVYNIGGNVLFDTNLNGCDSEDPLYPFIKLLITNNPPASTVIADNSGSYTFPVTVGPHTITPVLENPEYFDVSPTTMGVNFPDDPNPFNQNFCITPIGFHPDLEVLIFPLSGTVPGSDAIYKIIYRNKGNQTMTSTVTLNYPGEISDYVVSDPVLTDFTPNQLIWELPPLSPMQTGEITLTLNLNTAADTPPLSLGDEMNLTVDIAAPINDETPIDNISSLQQFASATYNANDKIALEGTSVTSDKIGEYVHYLIRFQNVGADPATSVSLQDIIDTSKFNIGSLIPLHSSHAFTTRISQDNQVEFLFENINLPITPGSNEGYVVFKVRLLTSLAVGDVFTNTATIMYNSNTYTTSETSTIIESLAVNDFNIEDSITMFPNPAESQLIIKTNGTEIKSSRIYNMLGQLIMKIDGFSTSTTIDVTRLISGTYLVEIDSDKGKGSLKFIKR